MPVRSAGATSLYIPRRATKQPILYLRPVVLLWISALITYGETLIPPSVYERYIPEPDLMLGNVRLYAFLLACFLTLGLGYVLGRATYEVKMKFLGYNSRARPILYLPPLVYLATPLSFSLALVALHLYFFFSILSSYVTFSSLLGVVGLFATGQAGVIKPHMYGFEIPLKSSVEISGVVTWWYYYYRPSMEGLMSGRERSWSARIFIVTCVILFVVAILSLQRYFLVRWLVGLFVLYVRQMSIKRKYIQPSVPRLFVLFLAVGILVMGVASGFTVWRGQVFGFWNGVIQTFLVYGPTAANRLAAMINGKLDPARLEGFTRSIVFSWLIGAPLVPRMLGLEAHLMGAFRSSFDAISSAGLVGAWNTLTAFGTLWCAMGWFIFGYLFLIGFVCARAWILFLKGDLLGVLLYPHVACGLVLLWSDYFLFRGETTVIVLVWMTIVAYARWFAPIPKRSVAEAAYKGRQEG
jgi:hypothetical protein